MKLFSLGRTDLAVSSKLPTPVGLVKCRKTIIVLRTSVMVWYTWRSPWTVVFAHSVQMLPTERRRVLLYFFWNRFQNDGETTLFVFIRRPCRNHQIPSKKLLRTLLAFSLRSILNCSKYCTRSIRKHILCRTIQLPDHPPRFCNPRLEKMI